MPPDPCEQVAALSHNQAFKNHLQILKGKLGENYEAGYLLNRNADGSWQSRAIQGLPQEKEIRFSVQAGAKYEVFMHSHPVGCLSIFSPDDLRSIYEMWRNLAILDLKTFSFNVITAEGTTYVLKVDNLNDFLLFGAQHLKNDDDFEAFRAELGFLLDISKTINQSETSFLRVLNKFNSGMKLFKGSFNDFDHWSSLEIHNQQVVNTDCN